MKGEGYLLSVCDSHLHNALVIFVYGLKPSRSTDNVNGSTCMHTYYWLCIYIRVIGSAYTYVSMALHICIHIIGSAYAYVPLALHMHIHFIDSAYKFHWLYIYVYTRLLGFMLTNESVSIESNDEI